MKLEGKVAIITGACGGLGSVFSRRFLEEGAIVIMADVMNCFIESLPPEFGKYAQKIRIKKLDVTDKMMVDKVMSEINDEFGKIDILVNNAGGGLHTPKALEDLSEKDWNLVLDVNLKGTFFCCQSVAKYMIQNQSGRIINVSSIGGKTASIVTSVAYAAAKGGINSFTRRLALELGKYGINVNAIAPGTVISGDRMLRVWNDLDEIQQTSILESIPLGRLSSAEEQADVVTFLAEEASRYITGAVIDVNGGRFMAD